MRDWRNLPVPNYVAFGSMFASRTKPDAVRATLDLRVRPQSVLTIPIVAIGGIEPDTAVRVVEAGADAVAVISGLFDAPDVGWQRKPRPGIFQI